MRICDAVADAIAEEGASVVFGLMGDANLALWSMLVQDGRVRVREARHEAATVAMADGWFRATGQTGVATITNGPGLTNAATSLVAAARNRSSLVVVTGEVPPDTANPLQALDQRRFVEGCDTRYVSIDRMEALANTLAQAFAAARSEPGPVVVAVSNPLWEQTLPGQWRYEPLPALPIPLPGDHDLEALMAMIEAAERPILLAGRGAMRCKALPVMRELAGRMGALLGNTLQARGVFADDPWSLGILGGYTSAATQTLCGEADLVVAAGAELGYYTTWGDAMFPQAKVVRIDPGPARGGQGRAPDLHIRADAKATLDAALQGLGEAPPPMRFRTSATREVLEAATPPYPPANDGIDPRMLARRIGAALPKLARLTVGAGHFQGFAANDMALGPGQTAEFVSQFGAIGQTLPIALGIAYAEPDMPHLVIEGDGSLLMHLQELETAVRACIPLVLLVWNDRGYGAEFQRLPLKGFDPASAQWSAIDYAAVARALGGEGVTLHDLDGIEALLKRGFRTSGLFLIDAQVSQSEMSDNYRIRYRGERNSSPRQP
jgi:acetolactate synthase I/II/III large subunit